MRQRHTGGSGRGRDDVTIVENNPVRFGIAGTVEVETKPLVYDGIQARPRVQPLQRSEVNS